MAKKLIKKLNDREIYAKFADYASADENGDKISDRKVKSVSVAGRTMTVTNTDGEQEVPVVPVPDAAGLILKSGEDGDYEWGAAGAAPGHGKLILNLGNTQGVDTGFNADSPRDVTFTIPEATGSADGLMSAADKAEFDRISGAAFDAKAERSELTGAVGEINATIGELSTRVEGEISALDTTKADKSALDTAVSELAGEISGLDSRVGTLETDSATKSELNAAVGEINTTISGIQGDISDLETDKAEKSEVESAVNTLTDSINGLDGRVSTLESDSATKSELAAAVGEINTTISGIDGRVGTLESDSATKSELTAAVSTINGTISGIDSRVTTLESDVDTLESGKADKSELSAAVDTINDTIDGIDGRVTTLESDKADKDTDAVEDNLAKFDSTGNPVDAGKSIDDVLLKEEIDRVTFRTVIDDLVVEPGEPLVAEPDVTLINEIDESETVARRAYEDEFGHNITDAIAGKQDKLTATPELARKCLGVHPDGSIGWIVGCNLDDGKTLVDGVIVQVPNNARSFLQTSRSSITLNVNLDDGEIPNFVVEVKTTRTISVRVTSTIGELSTTLKYSKDKLFTLGGGKTYQVIAVGTCWSFDEFVTPADAAYDFGGIKITYDQNGAHAAVTDASNVVKITEPVQVDDFHSDRVYNVDVYSTCVVPFDIDTTLITSGEFYEVSDIVEDATAPNGYKAVMSEPLAHIVANHPYLYISRTGRLTIDIPQGEFITLQPTEETEYTLHSSTGEWTICSLYHYTTAGELPGFNTEYLYYGIVGQPSGSYHSGDLGKMDSGAWWYPMRMMLRRVKG
jgi:predicted  nucleic acid-binding Zn-ribbon protein